MIVNLWSYGIIIFLTNRAKSHTNLLQFRDGNGEEDMKIFVDGKGICQYNRKG